MRPLSFFPLASQEPQSEHLRDSLPGTRFLISSSLLSISSAFHVALDHPEGRENLSTVVLCPFKAQCHQQATSHADQFLAVNGGLLAVQRKLQRVHFKFLPTARHLTFFVDSLGLGDGLPALALPFVPERLVIWDLSSFLDHNATIGSFTQMLATLLQAQETFGNQSAHSLELVILDPALHSLQLPITRRTNTQERTLVSCWEACNRFVDWRGSVIRRSHAEGDDEESLVFEDSKNQQLRRIRFKPTDTDSGKAGLFSETALHAWRPLGV